MSQEAREVAASLASAEEAIRGKAFARLNAALPALPPESYRTLCIGLYYYYWYCDGREQQERAAAQIAALEARAGEHARAWRGSLVGVLLKFWDRLDYHRTNKYLNLFRELFQFAYAAALRAPRAKEALREWNEYLGEALLWHDRAKPLLLELICVAGQELLPVEAPSALLFLFCKPFLDLLAFSRDRVLRGAVATHVLAALNERLRAEPARRRLAEHLRGYARAPELPREALALLSELAAKLEGGEASAKSEAEEETNQSSSSPKLPEEAPEPSGAFADMAVELCGEGEEEPIGAAEEEDSDFLEEELLLEARGDELLDGLQGVGEEELYVALEDFRQSVPPYYFKTNKQKRKFFSNLNQKYFASMQNGCAQKIRKEAPSVRFNLGETEVRKFHKSQVITS